MDIDKLQRRHRVVKRQLLRQRMQLDDLIQKSTLNLEQIARLESMARAYKADLDELQNVTNGILENMEEEDDEFENLETSYMADLTTAADCYHLVESRISTQKQKQSNEKNRNSLLPLASGGGVGSGDNTNVTPKLKKIGVPTYDGDVLGFQNFKNLFENLVHSRTELSNVQKLFYLKEALVGKAKDFIRDFPLVDDAYPEAWEYLLNRFNNKRLVIRTLFRRLIELESIKNPSQISSLVDQVDVIMRGLRANGLEIDQTFSKFVCFYTASKLDNRTSTDWENSITDAQEAPTYKQLCSFLQIRAFAVEEKIDNQSSTTSGASKSKWKQTDKVEKSISVFVVQKKEKATCSLCGENHPIYSCAKFLEKSPMERYNVVKMNKLCLVCFGKEHSSSNCDRKKYKCNKCADGNHNYLLHFGESKVENVPAQNNEKDEKVEKVSYSCSANNTPPVRKSEKFVLLPTAIVHFCCNGKTGKARILLDSCSQSSLVSDAFVRKYKLPTSTPNVITAIKGIGGSTVTSQAVVNLTLSSRDGRFKIDTECDLISANEIVTFSPDLAQKLKYLMLADPSYLENESEPKAIDILLGAEYFGEIVLNASKKVEKLDIRSTNFGWIISGVTPTPEKSTRFCGFTCRAIDETLQKFWKIEEASAPTSPYSEEEQQCVKFFESNFSFASDGKFVVKLPLKYELSQISENRYRALSALKRVENKLSPELKVMYNDFMREYSSLGHMSLATTNNIRRFLPHHSVLRPESSTTSLRVVFNASAKEKNSLSLNDALMKGPVLQRDIFDILLTMRTYKFVFTCDIAKMYRMIWVHPEDRQLQSILWRESPRDQVAEYRLNTVTYGTTPASFIATKCLDVIAETIKDAHPKVAALIRNNFYMDDFVGGANTIEEAIEINQILHGTLEKFGFVLRKYMSNCEEFLKSVPKEFRASQSWAEIKSELFDISILGLKWCSESDTFRIKVNFEPLKENYVITRRLILSYLSRAFDPHGYAAPVTVRSKILLQKVWLEGKTWDAPVSSELSLLFRDYLGELEGLAEIPISRELLVTIETKIVSFGDASEKLYAAVVYVRSKDSCGNVTCRLACAKTRVAPLKELTIPRLELQAAVLLSELTSRVMKNFNISLKNTFAFSDSTVVLCWLSKPPVEWGTFVANRVKKVIESIPFNRWFYVNTNQNPADDATRGLSVDQLKRSSRWFDGPEFLSQPNFQSFFKIPNLETEAALERRKLVVACNISTEIDFIDNFSSYHKLLFVIARMCRWKNKKRGPVTNQELTDSFLRVVRLVQAKVYGDEINVLKSSKPIKKSAILLLNPVLDKDGILRVAGRLENSSFSTERKNPILIPSKSTFAKLFVRHVHENYFHAGLSFLMTYFSGKYWFVGGIKQLAKSIIRNCVHCTRIRGIACKQQMGQLPSVRVNVARPFANIGIDYAGPFTCRCVAHRTTRFFKIYVAVFICLTVRAVHLEIVSDLTTEGFLLAFQRFAARRGTPSNIWTDNATNFQGASNFFRSNNSKLVEFAAKEGVNWNFIPPRSPQFGGIWEAAVKSMKKHLVMATKDSVMSFEEYATLFARVEAVLNCRPLCYRKKPSQEEEIITPSHFLVGQSLASLPVIDQEETNLTRRLELVQNHLRGIWKIWSKDYINQLQVRSKTAAIRHRNLEVNDVVLVKDQRTRPYTWPLGRIVRVFPADDGMVRVVQVRTATGTLRRSINSIVLLPCENESLKCNNTR